MKTRFQKAFSPLPLEKISDPFPKLKQSAKRQAPRLSSGLGSILSLLLIAVATAKAAKPFKITILDRKNGWPLPLVQLTTTHNVTFISDNAGIIAIDLPELMDRETWFEVRSDGYQVSPDGFGFSGVRLTPKAGQSHRLEVDRTIIAKRLGRLTGAGLFSESQKLGEHLEWQESGIFGCDSIQTTVHRGKKFWLWGDSNLAHYPLGIFEMTGATTAPNPLNSFEPPLKLSLNYFKAPDRQPRKIAKIPGKGPTWLNGLISLPDHKGTPRLLSTYSKIRNLLDVYQMGLCVWNEDTKTFEPHQILWDQSSDQPKPTDLPEGHPVFHTPKDGRTMALFGDPFPTLAMPATFEAWSDPSQWQKLTPQASLTSVDGKKIFPHRGSIAWNAFRKKWVVIFTQLHGKPSPLGEIWYAEADEPIGPWGNAIKVLSHQNYTFYNPRIHPDLTPEGSSILLFEGTYTSTFSKAPAKTPRYDYNQILYRLDLNDPALSKVTQASLD